jgi:Protein of unknown function (DUF3048) N-terminal domain/Protein of unknown function (DUF3048) C-terminal domain
VDQSEPSAVVADGPSVVRDWRMRRLVTAVTIALVAVGGAVFVLASLGGPASGGPVAGGSNLPTAGPSASASALPTAVPPTPRPTPVPTPTPEPTPVLVPAPLTGLPVSPEAALRHPIAVMVDDNVYARPQAGFNAASVVWQAPAEGGVPRYMLVFQDEIPTDVGPIRSARQYYIEWAAEWRAMYVHHGGSPQAKATLATRGHGQWVYDADGFRWEGRFLFRVTDRFAPHNVMTDGEHLRRLAGRVGADDGPIEPVWSFAEDAGPGRRPLDGRIRVTYPYETITYRYDAATNTYRRYIDGSKKPQIDVADGEVVAPKNVVILRMAFGPLNDGHPEKDRQEARNVGKGQAWIATNGRTIKGTWRKASRTAPTLLFDGDGNPVTLTAGQTFVQVIALTYGFEIEDGEPRPFVRPGATEEDYPG